MKQVMKDFALAFVLGVVVPAMVLRAGVARQGRGEPLAEAVTETTVQTEPAPPDTPLRFHTGEGTWVEMDFEDYLLGAVLAEMPAGFEPEALKAQAVAARTYAQRAVLMGKHGDGSVCGSFSCCQAYITPEDYYAAGGTLDAVDKVRAAVNATQGLVLTYGGQLIEATYFSCSGGRTEDALAVWGTDVPYLQAVDSPGEEEAPVYTDAVFYTWQELCRRLEVEEPTIGELKRTDGGGVDRVEIGGKTFRGTQLRSLLGLRSTAFTLEPGTDGLTIRTRGYGHRVGMSQYGADAMALTGSDYREILAHYYPGTSLAEDYGCNLTEDVVE